MKWLWYAKQSSEFKSSDEMLLDVQKWDIKANFTVGWNSIHFHTPFINSFEPPPLNPSASCSAVMLEEDWGTSLHRSSWCRQTSASRAGARKCLNRRISGQENRTNFRAFSEFAPQTAEFLTGIHRNSLLFRHEWHNSFLFEHEWRNSFLFEHEWRNSF